MQQEQINIKTPEFVSLQFQTAGLGSRAAAFLIDYIILSLVNIIIIVGLVFSLLGTSSLDTVIFEETFTFQIAIALILLFLLNSSYFVVLEYFSGGKTLGKRIVGIRVIQDNGHSLTLLSSIIRNLLRFIDSLPMYYLVGICMVFFHAKNKRIGDLVAGTVVVHERRRKKAKRLTNVEKEINRRGITKEDLVIEDWLFRSLGTKEWNLVKTYCHRFVQLPSTQRNELTNEVSKIIFPKIDISLEGKQIHELENTLFILYLKLKEEWEIEL
ncbi:RDD family protein [Metabacillus niabensis]|uniref:RDD family membrane protein YckC n=1 Tax=Metabacillus niabensis TaxID=324854 RepID=A0ABT9YWY4_9BACI|nr:RDD family protein [Metabacillus niabensis]MDQ0224514.1 putative RDD family membrane protein YckC [Metabacillus niabensis]